MKVMGVMQCWNLRETHFNDILIVCPFFALLVLAYICWAVFCLSTCKMFAFYLYWKKLNGLRGSGDKGNRNSLQIFVFFKTFPWPAFCFGWNPNFFRGFTSHQEFSFYLMGWISHISHEWTYLLIRSPGLLFVIPIDSWGNE